MRIYRIIFLMTYIVVAIVGFGTKIAIQSMPEIEIIYPVKEDIEHYVSVSGTVNMTEYGIFPSISSDVESIYVKEGDRVLKDDTLAWVKKDDFSAPVMAGLEKYQNDLYNQYASAFAQLVNDSGVSDIYDGIKLKMLSNYTSVVQDSKRLLSPVDGIVTKINIKEGENTGVALPAFVVSDYDDINIICRIPEDKIDEIQIGQKVSISGSGLKRKYTGRVKSIASKANAVILSGESSSVDVIIAVSDPDSDIISGFSANCKISTGTDKNIDILPVNAIHQDESGKEFVYTLIDGKISTEYIDCEYITSQKVKILNSNNKMNVVLTDTDLKNGDRVKLKND